MPRNEVTADDLKGLSRGEFDDAISKNWIVTLGDGKYICQFPDDVMGIPAGFKAIGLTKEWWVKADEDKIEEAIEKNLIKLVDADGKEYTLVDWRDKYPDRPDPFFVLKLNGRFPPFR